MLAHWIGTLELIPSQGPQLMAVLFAVEASSRAPSVRAVTVEVIKELRIANSERWLASFMMGFVYTTGEVGRSLASVLSGYIERAAKSTGT